MLDVEFNLGMLAVEQGASPLAVIKTLQDRWNLPQLITRKARNDDKSPSAGDHGIPEIGRQELAFYNALTGAQKDAYRALRQMVDEMYSRESGWANVDPWEIGKPIDEWKQQAFLDLATNPMQAYLTGQLLATNGLNSKLIRPLLPTDRRAIEFMEHHAFNEIDDAFNGLKSDLRTALIEGMQRGDNPRDVARAFASTISDYETKWDTIAITETARAESQGRLQELSDNDFEYAVGSSAHDSRTCDDCLRLVNDKTVKVADTIGVSNYGRKRDSWVACIPLHPRCRCVWLAKLPD